MDAIQHIMPEPVSFDNPFKDYRKIRRKKDILRVSPTKWLVMGYNASFAALCSPNVSHWQDEENKSDGGQLKNSVVDIARLFTPETNTQFRDIIIQALSMKNLICDEAGLKEKAEKMLEKFEGKPGFDFIGEYADPFTFKIICEVMGFTEAESDELYVIIKAREQQYLQYILFNARKDRSADNDTYRELIRFMEKFTERQLRNKDNPHSLIARLITASAADNGDTAVDVLYLCSIILFLIYTGHHNMTNFLGNIIVFLSKHKSIQDALIADPGLVDKSINEFLRLEGPVQFLMVHAKSDFVLEQTDIKSGAELLVCIGASNRDETVFESPDEFKLDREMTRHLSFGYGAYRCIGSKLANMEIAAALKALLEKFPAFRVDKNGIVWKTDNIVERGPEKLMLKLL